VYTMVFESNALPASVDAAYGFLDRMMDLHGTSMPALLQSYVPTPALNLGDCGFLYDNALALIAYAHRSGHQARLELLMRSISYTQTRDLARDGRVRVAYHTDPFLNAGRVSPYADAGGGATDVGVVAWTGIALAHAFTRTLEVRYLGSATRMGNWMVQACHDKMRGGFFAGFTTDGTALTHKSTEHNIDVYAFFTMLHTMTHDRQWGVYAAEARTFVRSMWNAHAGHFWTGTEDDGVTMNRRAIPEDVQSSSYLAFRDSKFGGSIDWARTKLSARDRGFSGVSFSSSDRSGVWFEGTAHLAAGLLARNGGSDAAHADTFLRSLARAQKSAEHTDGRSLVAASKDDFQTGFGTSYFAAPHVGATAWYILARQRINPFVLPPVK